MRYFKFPKWLKRFYPQAIWDFFYLENPEKPKIYLTFDDGPNKKTTNWILTELHKYKAKATFFCIGENVVKHPDLYQKLIDQEHQIGNHTHQHLNGVYTKTSTYIEDVQKASTYIKSKLFRPPYGKLKPKQYEQLKTLGYSTVFWSHISYDFDPEFASKKRLENALKRTKDGSIVVFHDSDKAFPQLKKELPILLKKWHKAGFKFEPIKVKNKK